MATLSVDLLKAMCPWGLKVKFIGHGVTEKIYTLPVNLLTGVAYAYWQMTLKGVHINKDFLQRITVVNFNAEEKTLAVIVCEPR